MAEEAFRLGVAGIDKPKEPMLEYVKERMWHPDMGMQCGELWKC